MLWRHGGHQVAQNSTTTILSLLAAREKLSVLNHLAAEISGAESALLFTLAWAEL
jgi:hypothetical protein